MWEVDRVAFGATEQTSHIAVFPEEVTERIVRACSEQGDLVLDPFAGSGTVPKVAHGLGRRWLGVEIFARLRRGSRRQGRIPAALGGGLVGVRADKTGRLRRQKGYAPARRSSSTAVRVGEWGPGSAVAGGLPTGRRVGVRGRERPQSDQAGGLDQVRRSVGEPDRPSDPVRTADHLLLNCYKLRRHFNGVSRYRSALAAVATVSERMTGDSGGDYLSMIAGQEPSSFNVAGSSIDFPLT